MPPLCLRGGTPRHLVRAYGRVSGFCGTAQHPQRNPLNRQLITRTVTSTTVPALN
ncbi:hypothetical protein KCMC57_up15160 [Kitasatospora sp. CMC57]|uniref:Uncharacterized protein n=1 Tax=Kitasatospora sp. CMC57 TaxID=3231513 RepID=A0AB33JXU0_9ACTN